jgi:hypothetical protein
VNTARVVRAVAAAGGVGAAVAGAALLPGGGPDAASASPASTPASAALVKSAQSFNGDIRKLPQLRGGVVGARAPRPEQEAPESPLQHPGTAAPVGSGAAPAPQSAPAPSPLSSFEGLHFSEACTGGQCGRGHPPDTNGDVGPTYYIQTTNVAIGIYDKRTGRRVAGLTFNTLMSQGHFGNLCDTDNFGDPVVVYDTFHDHWVITDFAFQLDSQQNVVSPPGSFQCFAVSRTGDPVSGGWNFYSLPVTDALQDYPKFGVWPDGLYMTANMFGFGRSGFINVRAWALNLAQMEAGAATPQSVVFDLPAKIAGVNVFGLLPSNARAQTGTPPPATPNYLTSVWGFANLVRVWKFHVDWDNTANSTLAGPSDAAVATSWALAPATVPSLGSNNIDTLEPRLMMQNQYTNIGGVESLWDSHTVQGSSPSQSAVRYYQLPVTGGAVAASAAQGATWNPDSSSRFMPSVAVDKAGDMAIGYSVSSSAMSPAIRYAGRAASDPPNTLGFTEASLIEGTGSQVGNCGGAVCTRWGDYSAMTLDPDGCTFWYTNEYYAASGLDDHTRIGSFKFPSCLDTQTISFAALPNRTFGDGDFAVAATASSGLPVSFAASGNCTVSGASVHLTGAGSCTITASQPGSVTFFSAPNVARTFAIGKAAQTLTFAALPGRTFGDGDFSVAATASSSLPVSFSATGTCTVAGVTVHIAGAGTCAVTASQPGDANYSAAASVTQTFAIGKAGQSITFAGTLPNRMLGTPDFTVGASASSGLPVSFAGGGSCAVSGSTVHLQKAGKCTVTAFQAGDANFNAAASISRSFTVTARCTVPKLTGKTLTQAKRALTTSHCALGVVSRAYSKQKKGRVSAQSRRAGAVLAAGAKVNLTVSRGPKPKPRVKRR